MSESRIGRVDGAPAELPRADMVEIDHYPDALIATTPEGRILSWNLGAERTFGFSRAEAVGENLLDLIVPPQALAAARAAAESVLESGRAMYESLCLRKDGTLIYVDTSAAVFHDGDGGVRFVAIGARDITLQKYLREGAALEHRFSGLLEAAPDAMVIADGLGRIVLANSKVEELFGYARSELVGQPVEVLVPERFRARHPAHRTGYFNEPRSRPMGMNLDLAGRRKDGTEFPVEISLSPMESEQGPLVTAAIRDITERKRVEAKFRGLLEAAPDAMVIVDQGGKILLVNSQTEKLFGYPREQILGQSIDMLVPDRFHAQHPGHRADYFKSPRPRPMGKEVELYARRSDGTDVAVEISLSPLETEEGLLVTAAIRDITDRRQLEEQRREADEQATRQAQEANRLKSEFLANMSHELRTPLNAIIGFAQLMADGRVGPVSAPHKEYLGDILTSSRHLLQLINDVLDLAKVEAGRMEFHPDRISPAAIVREVCEMLRSLADSQGITLTTVLDEAPDEVEVDSAKLKQVLYNYLSNALKFTREEGRVTVRVRAQNGDYFRVEVEDTGIGIGPDDLGRLFVEFQQLDSSTQKKHQGTGLGLALTRRIVEAQGGQVGVQSQVGVGSLFYAVLPRRGRPVESKDETKPVDRPRPPESQTILVIEDSVRDRTWLIRTLEEAGFEVESVEMGHEAIALCRDRQFAAITLDLMLPDMSGWDVLRTIRANGLGDEVPVIVVTATAGKDVALLPVHDCLTKPVRPEVLIDSLRRGGLTPGDRPSILVVDDNAGSLKLAHTVLDSEGYPVIGVSDGETALSLAAHHQPSAIILDILMPNMDGFAFLERFRASENGRRTIVIVWTGADLTDEQRRRLGPLTQAIVSKMAGGTDALLKEVRRLAPARRRKLAHVGAGGSGA